MSGLKKGSSRQYIRIRDGKFYLSDDKEKTTPYDGLEGTIIGLSLRTDKFGKEEIEKLMVDVDTQEGVYTISLNFDSSWSTSFLSFLANADLDESLELIPSLKVEGDRERRNLFIKQNGYFLKSGYTKEKPNGLPPMKQIKRRSGKIEWDKEDFLEFFREKVGEYEKKLKGSTASLATKKEEVVDDDPIIEDDLPF